MRRTSSGKQRVSRPGESLRTGTRRCESFVNVEPHGCLKFNQSKRDLLMVNVLLVSCIWRANREEKARSGHICPVRLHASNGYEASSPLAAEIESAGSSAATTEATMTTTSVHSARDSALGRAADGSEMPAAAHVAEAAGAGAPEAHRHQKAGTGA